MLFFAQQKKRRVHWWKNCVCILFSKLLGWVQAFPFLSLTSRSLIPSEKAHNLRVFLLIAIDPGFFFAMKGWGLELWDKWVLNWNRFGADRAIGKIILIILGKWTVSYNWSRRYALFSWLRRAISNQGFGEDNFSLTTWFADILLGIVGVPLRLKTKFWRTRTDIIVVLPKIVVFLNCKQNVV